MSLAYEFDSARTAAFVPMGIPRFQARAPEWRGFVTQAERNATAAQLFLSEPPFDPETAPADPSTVELGEYSIAEPSIQSSLNRKLLSRELPTIQSSATEPKEGSSKSTLSNVQNITGAAFAALIIAIGFANLLAIQEATEYLSKARAAARREELRTAYRELFHGMDILLRSAKWARAGSELKEICSPRYPAAFGIGALRYVSDAAKLLPNWNALLDSVRQAAKAQGLDDREMMRGLGDTNGTSQRS